MIKDAHCFGDFWLNILFVYIDFFTCNNLVIIDLVLIERSSKLILDKYRNKGPKSDVTCGDFCLSLTQFNILTGQRASQVLNANIRRAFKTPGIGITRNHNGAWPLSFISLCVVVVH